MKTTKNPKAPATGNAAALRIKSSEPPETPVAVTTGRVVATTPQVQACGAMHPWVQMAWGDTDVTAILDRLADQTEAMRNGSTADMEALLFNQALTLQAMFTALSRRAASNVGEYLGAAETYLKLALRAQGQCRATLETLSEMKNPRPVAFVKQANIAAGHQQVNNGPNVAQGSAQRSRENPVPNTELACANGHAGARGASENSRNELLTREERQHGSALDGTTTTATGRSNQAVEAVAAINGATDSRR